MTVEALFLQFSTSKLKQFEERIETCLSQLTEDQIWARGHESENAIGNLALHLNGNLTQWIIGRLGGIPVQRDRDGEFSARNGPDAETLSKLLRATVAQATQIISKLTADQLTRTYTIQNYSVSGVEAVYHVVEHFAQHTAQIIFATKMLTQRDLGFYRHLSGATHNESLP
jgi:uncharacterized damage-inducible protein DinB